MPGSLLPYLNGVRSKGALIFNIRGYEIIADKAAGNFSKPHVRTMFPGFSLHQADKVFPDSSLGIPALRIDKQKTQDVLTGYGRYYFLPKGTDTILGIAINGSKPPDISFDRAVVDLVLHDGIPDSLISGLNSPEFLFAGRRIPMDSRCMWRGANVLQCHGFGEMNWSLHPDMNEAKQQTSLQEAANRGNRQFTIEKEEDIPVVFESFPVMAHRLQFRVKGINGIMTKMEGSRTLIVYYITAGVRGRFISCVLSHWTSDYIEENGLPPLLGTVMQLK